MHRAPDLRALRERAEQDLRAFERQAPRRRHRDGGAAAGALRAVRQHRRRRAEHALGRRQRLGGQDLGGDPPSRRARHGPVLRSTQADAEDAGQIPARHRADGSLPVARLHGPLSAGARRRRARSDPRRGARRDRGAASGGRSGAVAALARCRGAVPAGATRAAGLGRAGRRGRGVRRSAVLDLHQPECGIRRAAGPGAGHAAHTHAAGDAGSDRAAAAAAAGSARADRARPAARQPAAGHRPRRGQPVGHTGDADHPHRRPRDVRVGQRGRAGRVAAAAGADLRWRCATRAARCA